MQIYTFQEMYDVFQEVALTRQQEINITNTIKKHDSKWLTDFYKFSDRLKGTKYNYMITFTLRPDIPYKEIEDSIEQYIVRQFKRAPLQILRSHYVKEYTKAGVPHWHVAVETTKCLKTDRFNYYKKLYGHVDISASRHKNYDILLNYLAKDNLPIKLY